VSGRRRPWFRLVLAALLLLPLLTGCWDSIAISDQAPVIALGVGPGRQGQLTWTFVVPNPAITESSLANLSPSQMYYTLRVEAPSFPEAVSAVQTGLARHLFLGQLQVVAWSSRLTASTIRALVTDLNDDGTVDKTFWAVATPHPAELLRTTGQSISEPVPGYYLADLFTCGQCQPLSLGTRGWRVWTHLLTPGLSLAVPYATPTGTVDQLVVYGAHGPPVVWTPGATGGWAYLTGRVAADSVAVRTVFGRAVVDTASVMRRVRVVPDGRGLTVGVHLFVSARVVSLPPTVVLTASTEAALTRAVATRIARMALTAIQTATHDDVDPFGFTRTALWEQGLWLSADRSGLVWPVRHAAVTVTVRLVNEGIMP
jgi:spore germination protein KC